MKLKFHEIFIGSLLILLSILFLNISNNTYTISDLYLLYFSYLPIYEHQIIYQIIVSTIHMFWIIYIFSKYIPNQISKNSCYIFTRTNKRKLWLLKNYILLLKYLLFYYLFQFFFIFILAYINKLKFTFSINSFFSLLVVFLSTIVSSYIIIIFCNTISLFVKEIYSYICTVFVLIINTCLVNFLYINNLHNIIKILPFSQGMVLLQNYSFINRDIFKDLITNFNPFNSFLYSLFILSLLLFISIKKISSMEIL